MKHCQNFYLILFCFIYLFLYLFILISDSLTIASLERPGQLSRFRFKFVL